MSPSERGRNTVPYISVYLEPTTPAGVDQECPLLLAPPPVSSPTMPDTGSQHTADEDTTLPRAPDGDSASLPSGSDTAGQEVSTRALVLSTNRGSS